MASRLKQFEGHLLHGWMTVNEIRALYPETAAAFEPLVIDREQEGYDCLDEVAWRRGIRIEELLAQLERLVEGSSGGIRIKGEKS